MAGIARLIRTYNGKLVHHGRKFRERATKSDSGGSSLNFAGNASNLGRGRHFGIEKLDV